MLCQILTISAKIPTVIHAATTNLLIFHTFLKSNDNYKATKQGSLATEAQAQVTAPLEAEDADDPAIAPGPATASDWGLTFTEMSEEQLMNGFIVKERLSKLLDHPSLTNHLLRAKNLLPLLVRPIDYTLTNIRDGKLKQVFDIVEPSLELFEP